MLVVFYCLFVVG